MRWWSLEAEMSWRTEAQSLPVLSHRMNHDTDRGDQPEQRKPEGIHALGQVGVRLQERLETFFQWD